MYRCEELRGLPVNVLREGMTIGVLAGLVVDPDSKRVRWLSVNSCGRLNGRHWVSMDQVRSLSSQGVTIYEIDNVKNPKQTPEAELIYWMRRTVLGKRVVTTQGQVLGEVRDYEFEPDTWALTQLLIPASAGISGKSLNIPASQLLEIRAEALVIGEADSVQTEIATPNPEAKKRPVRTSRAGATLAALWQMLLPFHH